GAVVNYRLVLAPPVKIRRDRPRTNVHIFADHRVADIAEMAHLGVSPQPRSFHLREVADVDTLAQVRSRPQMAVRPDVNPWFQHGVLDRRRSDHTSVSDARVHNDRRRPDDASDTDRRRSTELR